MSINLKEKYVNVEPYIFGLIVGNYIINNKNIKYTLVHIKDTTIIENLNNIINNNPNIRVECINRSNGNYNVYIDEKLITYNFNNIFAISCFLEN